MSYGNYYPYGYQPTYSQTYQNNDLRNQYQQMLPTQMSGTNTDERIWVQGKASADAYLMAPNSFVRLWDSLEPCFYEKRSDSTGRPYMETYEYKKRGVEAPFNNQSTNVYDEKIKALESRIEALEGRKVTVHDAKSDANDATV